jgi:hypothetical protein
VVTTLVEEEEEDVEVSVAEPTKLADTDEEEEEIEELQDNKTSKIVPHLQLLCLLLICLSL